ncbi:acyltransferase [Turicibacter bilis]|uniref:Acyltransferase n=1 Tax=Turicibacter bilis TaxID=2735723 RepID=A0A9Q9CMZ1_9FIRM|nr:acyltransferase [Turicibacter bilis]MBS3198665.1 acyltransferase [Turicibacter bilis]UUF08316.1 acyltransferase [Turicibacter bilis]
MNNYLSKKITYLTTILTIGVVYIHSYNLMIGYSENTTIDATQLSLNSYLQVLISHELLRFSVPVFFVISGLLFFYSLNKATFFIKLKKRCKTLLIPYLLINSIWFVLIFLLMQIPMLSIFFTGNSLSEFSIKQYLYWITIRPFPGQLWYIRILIILYVFSPLIYFGVKKLKNIYFIIILLLWSFDFNWNTKIFEGLFFFSLGGYIAFYYIRKINNLTKINVNVLLCSFLLIIFNTFARFLLPVIVSTYISKIIILLNLYNINIIYDYLFTRIKKISIKKIFKFLSEFSFQIYVLHEPLLGGLEKVIFKIFSFSNALSFIVYIINPIVVILTIIVFCIIFKKFNLKIYNILFGKR